MTKLRALFLALIFLAAPFRSLGAFIFETLNDPNAVASAGGTLVQGVSGTNIVGIYYDANAQAHGFLYNGSSFTTLDDPASVVTNGATVVYDGTYAVGVSGSQIVGWYTAPDTSVHGFLYSAGSYTSLEDPNDFQYTIASGLSGGNIAGSYLDQNDGLIHGFLYNGSTYVTLTDPSILANFGNTYANGIDGNNIVGSYQSPANNGFLFNGSTYSNVNYPVTNGFSIATGISGTNIVGYYQDGSGNIHSFTFDGNNYTSFDYPGSSHTYASGIWSNTIVGYYIDNNNYTNGFIATLSAGSNAPPTGSLQVSILPPGAVTGGAEWQVDGGSFQTNLAIVTNLSPGNHTVNFNTISGWFTPTNQTVNITSNSVTMATGTYFPQQSGSLQVILTPAAAVAAGAAWEVDGGAFQGSQTIVTNLSLGTHSVSFLPIFGWNTPSNQILSVSNAQTTSVTVAYSPIPIPPDGLILLTNGAGGIQHKSWPATLVPGSTYTVKAVPAAGSLFEKWVGGTNLPLTPQSASASYTFTMQPGLLLQADFVTNIFPGSHGAYFGLFAPTNGPRQQTNSGAFKFDLTAEGSFSGDLRIGQENVPFSGKFNPDGLAGVTSRHTAEGDLLTSLQLAPDALAVSGTISNSTGAMVAQLAGYREFYSSSNQTTNFGRYSLTIAGTTNPATGPFGTSYGTVQVQPSGKLTFSGSLADGTPASQSSLIFSNGLWPMYLPLYGGKGSLWSWIFFATNGDISSSPYASWINPTNANKAADYRIGFTNEQASASGGLYTPANQPLPTLTNAQITLQGGDLSAALTNTVSAPLIGTPSFTSVSNRLTLVVDPATGIIHGSFTNGTDGAATVKFNGILLPQGDGAGYFLGTNHSGSFVLTPD